MTEYAGYVIIWLDVCGSKIGAPNLGEDSMNVFDIIGPIMIGPSSSHTAGAVRVGRQDI